MSFLVFNRSHSFDFANWLTDCNHDLFLFSDRIIRDMHKYRGVEIFPSFDESGLSELRATELARHTAIARVLCHSEYDLVRAAALREKWGLPGQGMVSAQAYRNKFQMKNLVAKAGIPVATQRQLDSSPLQLLAFIEEHGFPVVVKPIDGGGSRGVEILHDQGQLCNFLKTFPLRPFMVERFVQGQLYHIDGLARNGDILFATTSCYFSEGCLNFQSHRSNGSYLLEADTPRHHQLVQFTQRVISALPVSPELGFHAEAFMDEAGDSDIVLCEIAARTAGGWIIEAIEAAYGINLNREWIRLSAGLNVLAPLKSLAPKRQTGFLIFPPHHQASRQLPQLPKFDWCRSYITDIGKHVNGGTAAGSVEFATMAIVEGSTSEQVKERLTELDHWLRECCVA